MTSVLVTFQIIPLRNDAINHNEKISVDIELHYWKIFHKISKVKVIILQKYFPNRC